MASTNKDYLKHYIFLVHRVQMGQMKGEAPVAIRQATHPGQRDPEQKGRFLSEGC